MEHSIFDQFRLNGQTALITGGNRGLGLAMAKALAEAGANISIAARDEDVSREAAAMIASTWHTDCMATRCDVTSTGFAPCT